MRIQFWQYLLDNNGNPLDGVNNLSMWVRVYLAGTNIEANIYLDADFGSMTTSSNVNLTTSKYGLVKFWIGDEFEVEGGYGVDQQFKVKWYNYVDDITEEIDNLYVFTPVRKIDITSSDIYKNKVISNTQGYNWDTHVDSAPYDDAHPHDMYPVVFFDLDEVRNKVISNKLGYQMSELSTLSTTTSADVSAADYFSTTLYPTSSVSTPKLVKSGSMYYGDVDHNFKNLYPAVNIVKNSDNRSLTPEKIESINVNRVRIWLNENIETKVVVIG